MSHGRSAGDYLSKFLDMVGHAFAVGGVDAMDRHTMLMILEIEEDR